MSAEKRNAPGWGSDVMAATLKDLGLRYVALNPGASYRGLHDSLVNFTGGDGWTCNGKHGHGACEQGFS